MSPAGRPALRLATPAATPGLRPDLVRLCAGEPVALAKVDMIAFVNSAYAGLDPEVHQTTTRWPSSPWSGSTATSGPTGAPRATAPRASPAT